MYNVFDSHSYKMFHIMWYGPKTKFNRTCHSIQL